MSEDDGDIQARPPLVGLNPYHDARAIIRLIQCSQCSRPIQEPMTLPCGNSICAPCLPQLYKRENITYPLDPSRSEAFLCPFRQCNRPHSLGDCSLDVTLNKMVDMMKIQLSLFRQDVLPSATSLILDERIHFSALVGSPVDDVMPHSRVLDGGRLVATYALADVGELDFTSEVSYTPTHPESLEDIEALDATVAGKLRDVVQMESECQVCYALMLDPLTTSCGHTFCRKCVARVLDHSNLCPVCRRRLPIPPGVQNEPHNKRLSTILAGLLPEQVSARIEAARGESTIDEELSMPLFPCTLAYPHMPTFLHIFEPRYRLMIRRVMEGGTQRFGMMAYNSTQQPQGSLGQTQFLQYGTVLHIQRLEVFPDGRSLLETTGVYRFRILAHSMHDGYMVGKIQRIDDISLAEEEAIEAEETSGPEPDSEDHAAQLKVMSTQSLLQYGLDFVAQARLRSAPWLHERVLAAYGQPPTDPASFPYWFASILPISQSEKYSLMPATSVRQRLQITARWIQRLEAARWQQSSSCIVL